MNKETYLNLLLTNILSFKTRSSQKQYLVQWGTYAVVGIIFTLWAYSTNMAEAAEYAQSLSASHIIFLAISLIIAVLAILAGIRRLHDIGATGWWILAIVAYKYAVSMVIFPTGMVMIIISTLIGLLPELYLLTRKGDQGENRFGPEPQL